MIKRLKKLDKLFWFLSKKEPDFNFEKDKRVIIHQTLALGSADDVRALFKRYGAEEIRKEFQDIKRKRKIAQIAGLLL